MSLLAMVSERDAKCHIHVRASRPDNNTRNFYILVYILQMNRATRYIERNKNVKRHQKAKDSNDTTEPMHKETGAQ